MRALLSKAGQAGDLTEIKINDAMLSSAADALMDSGLCADCLAYGPLAKAAIEACLGSHYRLTFSSDEAGQSD